MGITILVTSSCIIKQKYLFNKRSKMETLLIEQVKRQLSLSNIYGSWIYFDKSNKIFNGQIFINTSKSYTFKGNVSGNLISIKED
ncbi:hypothetical protein M2S00_01695 [Apilactobacillus sp. TMW 2.2459]|uniref:hypothetical protein n=1 Tax=Apilactobacillus xinyiensis TaxID=2841032 RepID=UPI00200F0C80|nr:hypothetical protein [Apilactobacillus xinyiensis]MCL0311832.1 hypothetical protein [Apilactobacillus xinyiensis]